jgi:hypothetical protein
VSFASEALVFQLDFVLWTGNLSVRDSARSMPGFLFVGPARQEGIVDRLRRFFQCSIYGLYMSSGVTSESDEQSKIELFRSLFRGSEDACRRTDRRRQAAQDPRREAHGQDLLLCRPGGPDAEANVPTELARLQAAWIQDG